VVFPDTRFINEVQFIKQQGGKIIRLWHGDRPYPLKGTQHEWSPSETELDLFGGVDLQFINNLGTTPAQFLHACVKWGIIRHLDIRRDLLSDVFSADVDACVPQVEPTPQTIGL
jgi:hypothetical protein